MYASMEAAEDEKLLGLCQAGNKVAFEELVRRYERKIRGYCLHMLHEITQSEDAAQEVFLKAYGNLNTYRAGARFSTWLFRIATNHCIDLARKNRRQRWLSFFSANRSEIGLDYEQHTSHFSSSDRFEASLVLTKLLEKLSVKNRSLLLLHEAYGLSHEELAFAQSCSIDSVKSRIKRSRRQILQAYQDLNET